MILKAISLDSRSALHAQPLVPVLLGAAAVHLAAAGQPVVPGVGAREQAAGRVLGEICPDAALRAAAAERPNLALIVVNSSNTVYHKKEVRQLSELRAQSSCCSHLVPR